MKLYLGDGVYVSHHPLGIELTTSDGERVTNRIVLEPSVWRALAGFVRNSSIEADDEAEQAEHSAQAGQSEREQAEGAEGRR